MSDTPVRPEARPLGRRGALALGAAALLGACARAPVGDPGGRYLLTQADRGRVQFSMLDGVNALRRARGLALLELDPALTAAAETHARDMAAQNRPWHFGSDGSSPPQRAARAGFGGRFRGEAISESFETETQTLAAWMRGPQPRSVLLDPLSRQMGVGWHQDPDGKLWWTVVTGSPDLAVPLAPTASITATPLSPSPAGFEAAPVIQPPTR